MKLSFLVALSGIAATISAVPASIPYAVHEKRDLSASSSQWQRQDVKLDRRTTIPMSIALTQRNLEHGSDFLRDVSDPGSVNYGKHWSQKQVMEAFSASDETITIVTSWLVSEGISEERITLSKGRNWVKFEATIEEAEYLLKTEYKVYESIDGKAKRSLVTDEYSLPLAVRNHVDFVTPTVQFDTVLSKRSLQKRAGPGVEKMIHQTKHNSDLKLAQTGPYPMNSSTAANATGNIDPTDLSICQNTIITECVRALYNMPNGTLANSSIMIVEFSPNSYIPEDLELYLAVTDPWIPFQTQPIVELVDGAVPVIADGQNLESNLDLQLAVPLVYPQEVTYVQVGDPVLGASFNTFLDAIDGTYCTSNGGDDPTNGDPVYPDTNSGGYNGHDCGTIEPGAVISISYGSDELRSAAYQARKCNEYMKLGLQGVSVLWASGDSGASGLGSMCCVNPGCTDGATQDGTLGGYFLPGSEPTCPYVTAVGATQVNPGASVYDPESATDFSGGGFSNQFSTPDYQKAAVSKYLAQTKLPFSSSLFNSSGRAYPDISANGNNIVIIVNGSVTPVGGTSASTPIVASLFTLINNQLLAAGKPVIGFANPVLYAHPEAMNDIVSGNAPACNTPGFAAVPGWDPVTGLGTPDYVKLLDVFLNL